MWPCCRPTPLQCKSGILCVFDSMFQTGCQPQTAEGVRIKSDLQQGYRISLQWLTVWSTWLTFTKFDWGKWTENSLFCIESSTFFPVSHFIRATTGVTSRVMMHAGAQRNFYTSVDRVKSVNEIIKFKCGVLQKQKNKRQLLKTHQSATNTSFSTNFGKYWCKVCIILILYALECKQNE